MRVEVLVSVFSGTEASDDCCGSAAAAAFEEAAASSCCCWASAKFAARIPETSCCNSASNFGLTNSSKKRWPPSSWLRPQAATSCCVCSFVRSIPSLSFSRVWRSTAPTDVAPSPPIIRWARAVRRSWNLTLSISWTSARNFATSSSIFEASAAALASARASSSESLGAVFATSGTAPSSAFAFAAASSAFAASTATWAAARSPSAARIATCWVLRPLAPRGMPWGAALRKRAPRRRCCRGAVTEAASTTRATMAPAPKAAVDSPLALPLPWPGDVPGTSEPKLSTTPARGNVERMLGTTSTTVDGGSLWPAIVPKAKPCIATVEFEGDLIHS
mmetsp:Transcript_61800/g.161864  ORF Transcript_61800/g.161864 Transcript_61800/m.161864 type:complete len:333 (+) Transcript_61800:564-1562(+)